MRLNLMRFFLKMFPAFHRSMMGLNLNIYSGRLPKWGSMQSGDIFEHRILERPTKGNAGSYYPTPVTYDSTPGGPNNHYKGLGHMGKHLWKTPSAGDMGLERRVLSHIKYGTLETTDSNTGLPGQVKLWATPQARDWKGATGVNRHSENVPDQVKGGKLNPEFVELLMGFPVGWTSLDFPPAPVNRSTPMSRHVQRLARKRQTRGLRASVTPWCHNARTRYSRR
jgi:hypothetical protein